MCIPCVSEHIEYTSMTSREFYQAGRLLHGNGCKLGGAAAGSAGGPRDRSLHKRKQQRYREMAGVMIVGKTAKPGWARSLAGH